MGVLGGRVRWACKVGALGGRVRWACKVGV